MNHDIAPQDPPRIAVTCGEPAGVGYELVAAAAAGEHAAELVILGDTDLLVERSRCVGVQLTPRHWTPETERRRLPAGEVSVDPIPLPGPAVAGTPDPAHAASVIESIRRGTQYCLDGTCDALVTAPVQKGSIIDAGIAFTGHTELLAELTGADPVMMLTTDTLRVALATTHLPLADVPAAITPERLESIITKLHHDLVDKFAIAAPHILVTGLNPHAGENGHLGREEIETITPVVERLRAAGLHLSGPAPADTAFTPHALQDVDAVLAMYHDQGLPVVKHAGFGQTVNVTLGLPIIRTSVDHGTALSLAGTGRADGGSLAAAVELAAELAMRRRHAVV